MAQAPAPRAQRRIVKPHAKGQITIPAEFREALGIDSATLLTVTLIGDRLEIRPLRPEEETLRRYTQAEIDRFVEEDKLDPALAERVRALLRREAL